MPVRSTRTSQERRSWAWSSKASRPSGAAVAIRWVARVLASGGEKERAWSVSRASRSSPRPATSPVGRWCRARTATSTCARCASPEARAAPSEGSTPSVGSVARAAATSARAWARPVRRAWVIQCTHAPSGSPGSSRSRSIRTRCSRAASTTACALTSPVSAVRTSGSVSDRPELPSTPEATAARAAGAHSTGCSSTDPPSNMCTSLRARAPRGRRRRRSVDDEVCVTRERPTGPRGWTVAHRTPHRPPPGRPPRAQGPTLREWW